MSNTHEVISAFLDDERFNPDELAAALSEPQGRDLLLDLVALRHVVQPESKAAILSKRGSVRLWLRPSVAAAALVVAVVGGYVMGQSANREPSSQAPTATRVVEVAGAWQDVLPWSTRLGSFHAS